MKLLPYLVTAMLLVTAATAYDFEIINTDPAPIQAGEYADITIRLTASPLENEYRNMVIQLRDNDDIRIVGDQNINIGSLTARSPITRTFRMYFSDDIPEGEATIPFLIKSNQKDREINTRIFIQDAADLPELEIGQVTTVPDTLLPDTDNNELNIVLQNLGEREAQLVKAELHTNETGITESTAYSLTDSVSSIQDGQEATLDFTIDVDEAVRDDVPATLHLRYRSKRSATDTYEQFTKDIPLRLPIDDAPFLEISQANITPIPQGTTENDVTFTVTNTGSETADEVRIRLFPDISYPFIFEATTLYISSELPPGESVTQQATLEVTDDAQLRDYPIRAELESLVSEALYTRDDTLTVRVTDGTGFSTRTVGIGIIATVVLIGTGLGIYNKYKR